MKKIIKSIAVLSVILLASCSQTKESTNTALSEMKEANVKSEVEKSSAVVLQQETESLSETIEIVEREVTSTKIEEITKESIVKEVVSQTEATIIVIEKAPEKSVEVVEKEVIKAFSHQALDELLKKYVSASGVVNYTGLKGERAKLDTYIATLTAQKVEPTWSRNEKLAFYINAYNAYTIQLILNNYPTSSIMKINGGKSWDLSIVNIGGKKMSLNHLENKIIRPVFKEPRIHFVVNCAAVSCPKLMNGAFLPNQLSSQLARQTRAFIRNTKENQITENEVKISQIFEWYATDFGDIKTFINKYSSVKAGEKASVSYNQYNWNLNGK